MIFQRNSATGYLPLMPSTYSAANSILTTHVNFDDIRKIMISDPSFLINMLIAAGNVRKVLSLNEIITAVGVANIQKIVRQSKVFPFSYAQEYKSAIDPFKLLDQVKKTTVVADLIAKDFNSDMRDRVVILNSLLHWHKFYALCFNIDLVIKKDFLTAKNFFRDFIKDKVRSEDILNIFTDNKSIIRGICKIAEEIYETKTPADHLFKIFPQQDKTELASKILGVLESEEGEFFKMGDIIDYAMSLEEHVGELNAKRAVTREDKVFLKDASSTVPKSVETADTYGTANVLKDLYNMFWGDKTMSEIESFAGILFRLGVNAVFIDESLPGKVIFRDILRAEKCEISENDNIDYVTRMLKAIKFGKRYKDKDLHFLKNIHIFSKMLGSVECDAYVLVSSCFGAKVLFLKEELFSEDELVLLDFSIKLIDVVSDLKKLSEAEKKFSEYGSELPATLRVRNKFNMLKLALDDYKLNLKNYSNVDHFKFGDVYVIFDLLNKKYENVMREFYNTVVSLNN